MTTSALRHLIVVALIPAVTGCSPFPRERSSQEKSAKPGGSANALSIEGAWQVAEVDGQSLVGVTLKGANGVLTWEPACAGWSISYQQDGPALRFITDDRPPGELRVVCAIGFPESLPSVFRVLPALNQIDVPKAGSVRLAGGGHVVRLERLLSEADRPVRSLEGRWSVSMLDGKRLPKGSLKFTATRDAITWEPSCARQVRSYFIENDRIAVRKMPESPPPPPPIGGQVAPPRTICTIGLHPDLKSAFATMEEATYVRPASAGSIIFKGNSREFVLTPIPD